MEISKEKVNLISHLTLNQMRQSSTVILTDLTGANIYIFQENITEPSQCTCTYYFKPLQPLLFYTDPF